METAATANLRLPLLVALASRASAVYLYHPGFPPMWGGETPAVARSIARGMGFASPYNVDTGPTALVPPVYTYLLAGLFKVFGSTPTAGVIALAINVALSAMVVIPIFVLARRLFDKPSAVIAVWLWALFPLTGYTDALYIWNTSLFVILLTSYLALTFELSPTSSLGVWMGYGLLAGLMTLTDPSCLTVAAVCGLWLAGEHVDAKHRLALMLPRLLLAALIASAVSGAWLVRNYAVFDRFVFFRSGFGLELDLGVRELELTDGPPKSLPNRNEAELLRYEELGELRYVESRGADAVHWIEQHRREYAVRVVKRLFSYWTGRSLLSYDYLSLGRFQEAKVLLNSAPVIGAFTCLVAMWLTGHRALWAFVGIFALYPVGFYLTHVLPRYRLPLEPLLLILAAGVPCEVRRARCSASVRGRSVSSGVNEDL